MLEFVNIGVAMENAHKELLPHATIVTKTVQENGVYHFLMMDADKYIK